MAKQDFAEYWRKDFPDLLHENGFTVIKPKNPNSIWIYSPTWFYFFKDGIFTYVQNDGHYSTVHKPCETYGTGFPIGDMELTLDDALAAHHRLRFNSGVEFYKTVDEFINSPDNKWANYYVYIPE